MAEAAAQRQGFSYALTPNRPEDRRKVQCHGLEPWEMTEVTSEQKDAACLLFRPGTLALG